MSASREKKVRQEQESTGYTDPKTAKEAKERKEEKRSSSAIPRNSIPITATAVKAMDRIN